MMNPSSNCKGVVMIRGIIFFVAVWIITYVGIDTFRHLSGKDKLVVAKTATYAAFTALVALFVVLGTVFLF